jgi:TPR repeat protein
MKAFVRTGILALAVMALTAPAIAGPHEDGLAAYRRGDYATTLRLWRPLAEQGQAWAQFNLGLMHRDGEGVPQDYAAAHMWLTLAAAQGFENAKSDRDIIARRMTHGQIEEATLLVREWRARHPQ